MEIELYKLIALRETLRDMTATATRFRDGAQVDGEDGLTDRIDAARIVMEWLDADSALQLFDAEGRFIDDYEAGKAEAELCRLWRAIYGREVADADTFDDEPIDPQVERDQRDYEAGKAEAELRRAERSTYGREVADAFHAQDDLNRFNRGEDD